MPVTILMHGHGTWLPRLGFTRVPEGCTFTLYTHMAKMMPAQMAKEILEGSFAGEPERTCRAGESVPELVLSSLLPADYLAAQQLAEARGAKLLAKCVDGPAQHLRLSHAFTLARDKHGPAIDFHWVSCQKLALNDAGGGRIGINAIDLRSDPEEEGYAFRWKGGGNVVHHELVRETGRERLVLPLPDLV